MFMDYEYANTHIFMFTNIKHDICSSKHIKYQTMYVQFATRNPPTSETMKRWPGLILKLVLALDIPQTWS